MCRRYRSIKADDEARASGAVPGYPEDLDVLKLWLDEDQRLRRLGAATCSGEIFAVADADDNLVGLGVASTASLMLRAFPIATDETSLLGSRNKTCILDKLARFR